MLCPSCFASLTGRRFRYAHLRVGRERNRGEPADKDRRCACAKQEAEGCRHAFLRNDGNGVSWKRNH